VSSWRGSGRSQARGRRKIEGRRKSWSRPHNRRCFGPEKHPTVLDDKQREINAPRCPAFLQNGNRCRDRVGGPEETKKGQCSGKRRSGRAAPQVAGKKRRGRPYAKKSSRVFNRAAPLPKRESRIRIEEKRFSKWEGCGQGVKP